MITAGARFAVPLAGLIMAGCGLVTSRAAPPTTARAIDPAAEWSEIKANAPAHATLTVSVRPTQPENIVTIIPSARVRIVPYASGLWEELSTLLRWKYESAVSAAQRDQASRRLDEAIARYEEALATAGLRDLSHSFVVSLDTPADADLVTGDYVVLSEYRTIGRGPSLNIFDWLERVRVAPPGARLTLDDANRFCADAFTMSGARCRNR